MPHGGRVPDLEACRLKDTFVLEKLHKLVKTITTGTCSVLPVLYCLFLMKPSLLWFKLVLSALSALMCLVLVCLYDQKCMHAAMGQNQGYNQWVAQRV